MATPNTARPTGEALYAASRQVWLASLGAAAVTRDWAQNEAGALFRTLVKEGTAVESRTFRKVGDRLESSYTMANDLWRTARGVMTHQVKSAADAATTLVRETLPARLPRVAMLGALVKPRKTRPAKSVMTRAAAKKTVRRAAKRRTKRG